MAAASCWAALPGAGAPRVSVQVSEIGAAGFRREDFAHFADRLAEETAIARGLFANNGFSRSGLALKRGARHGGHAALRPGRPLRFGGISLAMTRQTRSSPVFSDTSDRPSFLRTTAVKNPRTEWGCQPVASIMVAMVAPCLLWSIAST